MENAARPLSHDETLRAQYDRTAELAAKGGDSSDSHQAAVAAGDTRNETYKPPHVRQ